MSPGIDDDNVCDCDNAGGQRAWGIHQWTIDLLKTSTPRAPSPTPRIHAKVPAIGGTR